MKKIIGCLLVGMMVLGVVGCSQSSAELTSTLEEIMAQVYEKSNATLEAQELSLPKTMIQEINDENFDYFFGDAEIEFTEAIGSEAMITSIAHSVVLLRVDDNADIEAVKKEIKDNANGRKWICVGVPEDKILVENIGHVIILIMDNQAEVIQEAFLSLAK